MKAASWPSPRRHGTSPAPVHDPLGSPTAEFGNPEKPDVFFQFREACRGMADACRAFDTPVTGGNVSFYSESPTGAIDPTPTVGMVRLLLRAQHRCRQPFRGDGRRDRDPRPHHRCAGRLRLLDRASWVRRRSAGDDRPERRTRALQDTLVAAAEGNCCDRRTTAPKAACSSPSPRRPWAALMPSMAFGATADLSGYAPGVAERRPAVRRRRRPRRRDRRLPARSNRCLPSARSMAFRCFGPAASAAPSGALELRDRDRAVVLGL